MEDLWVLGFSGVRVWEGLRPTLYSTVDAWSRALGVHAGLV